MTAYRVLTENNSVLQAAFSALPRRLYERKKNPQDKKTEQEILQGKHLLSDEFQVFPFVVQKDGKTVSRTLLTVYPADPCGYFGFFESENDEKAVKVLFDALEDRARELHLTTLFGPVNASFWIGYRLKTDHFDQAPYTGEPYNQAYYEALLLAQGFQQTDRYTSNLFRPVPPDYVNKKYEKRTAQFLQRGIVLKSLEMKDYDRTMQEVYGLLTALYADFPGYKPISEEKFLKLFGSYRLIVNPAMVKFAYDRNRMIGFFICLPDYKNALYGSLSPRLIHALLWTKKHAKNYVLLYLGADPGHLGLGPVLTYDVIRELQRNGASSVGALIHEQKITGYYAKDLLIGENHYALYQKKL